MKVQNIMYSNRFVGEKAHLIHVSSKTKRHSKFKLGIEFYLFVSHDGMNDRGSTCKFRNALYQNCPVLAVFKYTTGRYSEQQV